MGEIMNRSKFGLLLTQAVARI